MLTDFKNSFTDELTSSKVLAKKYPTTPTLPCEILMLEKDQQPEEYYG